MIETFSKLGYKYLAATSNKLRGNRGTGKKSGKEDGMPEVLSENYPWFRRSIMVFKRQTPIVGLGCTPKWAKKVVEWVVGRVVGAHATTRVDANILRRHLLSSREAHTPRSPSC